MSDIEASGGGHKKGKKKVRAKKMSTRVDFTPLVDLAMLLITFFMLTTTMAQPQVMEINMPVDDKNLTEEQKNKLKESLAMTLLLAEQDQIVYYYGQKIEETAITGYGKNGIRKILLEESRKRNARVDSIPIYKQLFASKRISEESYRLNVRRIKSMDTNLMVLIKSDEKSNYNNLVDILDEMLITNIGRYAIVDISPREKQALTENPNLQRQLN